MRTAAKPGRVALTPSSHLQNQIKAAVIESRWVSTALALAGQLRPRRLNNSPLGLTGGSPPPGRPPRDATK
jgi:hypothetical protein